MPTSFRNNVTNSILYCPDRPSLPMTLFYIPSLLFLGQAKLCRLAPSLLQQPTVFWKQKNKKLQHFRANFLMAGRRALEREELCTWKLRSHGLIEISQEIDRGAAVISVVKLPPTAVCCLQYWGSMLQRYLTQMWYAEVGVCSTAPIFPISPSHLLPHPPQTDRA